MAVQRLGPYRVLKQLGQPGLTAAYLARHEKLQQDVVIKVASASFSSDPNYRKIFLAEAQALSKLSHPRIAQVFESSIEAGPCWMATEYVEGEDLQTIIDRHEPLPVERILRVARDVADALDHAHKQGFVHRDLRPGAIVVDSDGSARLTDFGIAIETEDTRELTRNGVISGMRHYMAPEQALGKPSDGRADIYALGAILFHGIARRPPFAADSPKALLKKIPTEAPTSLASLEPDLPPRLVEVVMKALSKKPSERYQTAAELRDVIQQAIDETSRKPMKFKPRARPVPIKRDQRPLILGMVAGLILLILTTVLFVKRAGPKRVKRDPQTSSVPAPPPPTKAPLPPPSPDAEPVTPGAARLELEQLAGAMNVMAFAAQYCELRGMDDARTALRKQMFDTDVRLEKLAKYLRDSGDTRHADWIRVNDPLVWLNTLDLRKAPRETAISQLGTFVAQVRPGARARVIIQRSSGLEELDLLFGQSHPLIAEAIKLAGLKPGQTVE